MTPSQLQSEELGWLIDASFIGKLAFEDQARVLEGASFHDFDEGAVLVEAEVPGRAVHLVVAGQAAVEVTENGRQRVVANVGPGHLVGERALRLGEHTKAKVTAITPMRTIELPGPHFKHMLDQVPALARYVDDLIELRERSTLMLTLLLREPILRSLGRDGLERLLQSGTLVRYRRGETIVAAGERGGHVYLSVRGNLAVFAPRPEGGFEQVATNGPGWLFGHVAILLDTPRTADVRALDSCELLQVSDRAFMELVARNPPLYRRLYASFAHLDLRPEAAAAVSRSRGAMVTAIWASSRKIGASTLAFGLSGALARNGRRVTLIDLGGRRNAQRLKFEPVDDTLGGVPIQRAPTSAGWPMQVVWPRDPRQTAALLSALEVQAAGIDHVVLSLRDRRPPLPDIVGRCDALVYLRWAHDNPTGVALGRRAFAVDAVRVEEGVELPMATNRNAVRIPVDPDTGPEFWRTGDLDLLTDEQAPMSRACHRLGRMLEGRTVGLALGGGGALGFAHIALLQSLHTQGVPIDYVAGVSFGAVVGALYASGGLERCELLLRRGRLMGWLANAGFVSLDPMVTWVDRVCGGRTLGSTEIPFFPVALDVLTGDEVVITRGTLAEGVRASSAFPGIFPAVRRGTRRLVDGGMVDNVPASVVWDAGANVIVASNIVPPHPVGRNPQLGADLRARLRGSTTQRFDDLLRSVFLLLSQTGRDRAAMADYVFDLDVEGFSIHDFARGNAIYEMARAQAADAAVEIRELVDARRNPHLDTQ